MMGIYRAVADVGVKIVGLCAMVYTRRRRRHVRG
jgi:hypothetical protein